VLDGGFTKWVKEGRATESCQDSDLHKISRDDPNLADHNEFDEDMIKFYKDMKRFETGSFIGKQLFKVVDARPKKDVDEGTIYGTANITFSDFFDYGTGDIKTLKCKDERREMLKTHGI